MEETGLQFDYYWVKCPCLTLSSCWGEWRLWLDGAESFTHSFLVLWERVPLCSPDSPRTLSVDQPGLQFTDIHLCLLSAVTKDMHHHCPGCVCPFLNLSLWVEHRWLWFAKAESQTILRSWEVPASQNQRWGFVQRFGERMFPRRKDEIKEFRSKLISSKMLKCHCRERILVPVKYAFCLS